MMFGASLYFGFESGFTVGRVALWALLIPAAVLGFRYLRKALQTAADRAAGTEDSQQARPTDIYSLLRKAESTDMPPPDDEFNDPQTDSW